MDARSPSNNAGRIAGVRHQCVAKFKRDLLIERTRTGLSRAKAAGKALGRPHALSGDQQEPVRKDRAAEVSLGVLSKQYAVSRAAIQRVEKRAS